MVFLDLRISFLSENVSELFVSPKYTWIFKLRCTSCQTDHPKSVFFDETSEFQMKNSKGTANFLIKCKECSKDASISIFQKFTVSCKDGSKTQATLAVFECRGCELTEWSVNSEGLCAKSLESGKIFENIDISDVWMEFDEKSQGNCSIDEFSYEIVRNNKY